MSMPWARISTGPDPNHFILGSEGNFGVITEATLKIKALPEVMQYSTILFHSFEEGTKFTEDVAKNADWPAACRCYDNHQFRLGVSVKP
jgi:alkyldihydroxyacetonephosphate synthase